MATTRRKKSTAAEENQLQENAKEKPRGNGHGTKRFDLKNRCRVFWL